MSFTNLYFDLQREAEQEFGPNTVVLIEKGTFMECYATETEGVAKRVGSILNMMVTRMNKKEPLSKSNPYMSGFPTCTHDKNIPVLLVNGMNVVWVEQKWDATRKRVIARERKRVYTPGTYDESPPSSDSYNICCVYSVGAEVHQAVVMDTSLGTVELVSLRGAEELNWFQEVYKPVERVPCVGIPDRTVRRAIIESVYPLHHDDIPDAFEIPLACLLHFMQRCNPHALKRVQFPKEDHLKSNVLSLHNNAIAQLDLVSSAKGNGVFGLVDRTSTAMGKRALRRALLRPMTSAEDIRDAYDQIAKTDPEKYRDALGTVPDMERLLKRVLSSPNMPLMATFFQGIAAMYRVLGRDDDRYSRVFQGDSFCDRFDYDLDRARQKTEEIKTDLDVLAKAYKCSVQFSEKERYFLGTTKKRAANLKTNFPTLETRMVNSNVSSVFDARIVALCEDYESFQEEQRELELEVMRRWIETELDPSDIETMCAQVARIDCLVSKAIVAKEYRLVRPDVCTGTSFVDARGIRHPLIPDCVGNDCALRESGLLLYGINGSGKTCLSKSVAVNLVLAQAGFYVFADSLSFAPYGRLFTRIQGDDNVYAGMSSFSVEMTELRSILRLADEHSLVIGDELCKGTEDESALSLVASSIEYLHKKRVAFVFATHLHKLPGLVPENVQIKHITCRFLPNHGIEYLRKVQDGPGDALYGIEVARHILGIPEVTNRAMELRETRKPKKSRYNKRLVMTECHVCKSTDNLHTHHIKHQKDYTHEQRKQMNHTDNLVCLCQTCHDRVHRDQLVIRVIDTPVGKQVYTAATLG